MLLLWLSIVCMIPFDLKRLDSNLRQGDGSLKVRIMDRIMAIGKVIFFFFVSLFQFSIFFDLLRYKLSLINEKKMIFYSKSLFCPDLRFDIKKLYLL